MERGQFNPKASRPTERRRGERRGKLHSISDEIARFIRNFWARFYRDFPENDRRRQSSDRRNNVYQSWNT